MTKKTKKTAAPVRTFDQSREALRKKVRMFYDLQRMRINCGQRVTPKGEGAEIQLHEYDIAILETRAKDLHKAEKMALKDVEDHLKTMSIWTDVLSDRIRFRGLGPTMAGVILSEFDIRIEDTVSKMWAFAGLRPIPCRRCKKCQAVCHPVPSDSKKFQHPKVSKCMAKGKQLGHGATFASANSQRPKKGEKLPYNAFLKTKLIGVLGTSLLKCGSPWRSFYDDYKHRKASAGWGESDGHRHNAAIRYMVKHLLIEIHKEWRTIEGLPVRATYHEEYLGHARAQA